MLSDYIYEVLFPSTASLSHQISAQLTASYRHPSPPCSGYRRPPF